MFYRAIIAVATRVCYSYANVKEKISMKRIALIAAMKEEIRPLLACVKGVECESIGKQRLYRINSGLTEYSLLQSGIGPENAATGAKILIDRCAPDLIINFGFAGALTNSLKPGDLVYAERILSYNEHAFTELTVRTFAGIGDQTFPGAIPATFVTTARVIRKKELRTTLPKRFTPAVVDMETAAVASIAAEKEISFMALRTISDSYDDEMGFNLEEFCDKDMNLQKWRVLLTIARKPWIVPQLVRLSCNTRSAGRKLANVVASALQLKPWETD